VTPRVAVVLTQLGYGGAERQAVELLRALAARPERPSLVVCLSDDLVPYGKVVRELGYRLEVLPRRGSFDLARLRRLRRLLRDEAIDLVHAVHLLASSYAWLAARPGGVPAVLPSVRGAVAGPGAVRSWLYRRMFRSCPYALVNSRRGARFMEESLGVPREKIAVIANGIDFAALRAAARPGSLRSELGLPEDAPLVAYVGKDSRVKNVPRAVQVVRRILDTEPNTHAAFVGGGLDESARARLLPDLPAARVHLLGHRDEIATVLADADLLLLTSDSEGCPNVVLEALALGTPVVSGDVGDVAEMVGGGAAGAVVPRGEVEAYSAAALGILADPERARQAAAAEGPRLEAEYGLSSMVEATLGLWRKVLAAGGTRNR